MPVILSARQSLSTLLQLPDEKGCPVGIVAHWQACQQRVWALSLLPQRYFSWRDQHVVELRRMRRSLDATDLAMLPCKQLQATELSAEKVALAILYEHHRSLVDQYVDQCPNELNEPDFCSGLNNERIRHHVEQAFLYMGCSAEDIPAALLEA